MERLRERPASLEDVRKDDEKAKKEEEKIKRKEEKKKKCGWQLSDRFPLNISLLRIATVTPLALDESQSAVPQPLPSPSPRLSVSISASAAAAAVRGKDSKPGLVRHHLALIFVC